MAISGTSSALRAQSSDLSLSQGSLLKGYFKGQEKTFLELMAQMSTNGTVVINGQSFSMKDQTMGALVAINQALTERESVQQIILKIFTAEDKWIEQITSIKNG
jgi:hypothetical protein